MKYINLFKRYKNYIILVFLLLIIIIGYIWANNVTAKQENNELKEDPSVELKKEVKEKSALKEAEEIKKIKVDIKGEIKKPDVYELDETSRVVDLIKKAGGLTKNANTSNINLSKKLKDENVIIIYSNEEIKSFMNAMELNTKKEENVKKENVVETNIDKTEYNIPTITPPCSNNLNSICIDKNDVVSNNQSIENKDTNITDKEDNKDVSDENENPIKEIININTATIEELQNLSGVGESKALAIIAYREEFGKFKSIEEIKNVKGIGDGVFEKIKDNITI